MLLWYWKWNENTWTSSQSLPESSDTLSGVLIGPVCSTSTCISSVSSMFFLLELFLWLLVSRDRGLLLPLLFLLSPGSLRSSRSNVEERTARKTQEQVRTSKFYVVKSPILKKLTNFYPDKNRTTRFIFFGCITNIWIRLVQLSSIVNKNHMLLYVV